MLRAALQLRPRLARAQPRRRGLQNSFWGGFQAPFPLAVTPQTALKCSYRSDRLARDGPVAFKSARRTEQDVKICSGRARANGEALAKLGDRGLLAHRRACAITRTREIEAPCKENHSTDMRVRTPAHLIPGARHNVVKAGGAFVREAGGGALARPVALVAPSPGATSTTATLCGQAWFPVALQTQQKELRGKVPPHGFHIAGPQGTYMIHRFESATLSSERR